MRINDEDSILTYVYQWKYYDNENDALNNTNSKNIPNATNKEFIIPHNHTLVDKYICVSAIATDVKGISYEIISQDKLNILNINDLPTGNVLIYRDTSNENILRLDISLSDPDGIDNFSYIWYRNNELIENEFSDNYIIVENDINTTIHAVVTYTDSYNVVENVISESNYYT